MNPEIQMIVYYGTGVVCQVGCVPPIQAILFMLGATMIGMGLGAWLATR